MKLIGTLIVAMALFASPASSQVVDIAGPWFIDFPQGRGTIILEKKKITKPGSPPVYQGWLTIPHPKHKNGYRMSIGLHSLPEYVVPGKNIVFRTSAHTGHIQFFLMNVSSSSSGVAWIRPGISASAYIRTFYNVQAPIHR